ncbi:hypothetical protein SELMODRAFT_110121 [Selaginella moellendorffii]|uniref:Pentacotripeptide-repeat region of PRORP domain-containing protein n=1 Tax=Selaginella moellendorffii TaxID=88036 RepID=D8S6S8_SELML|nr:hypothetical protein SELMODRAFT_110121 [Selaginella moellendorffii]
MIRLDITAWNTIIAAYCGDHDPGLNNARRGFDRAPKRDIVSWNTIISGYVQRENLEEAKLLFDSMPEKNRVSCNAMLAGYSNRCLADEAADLFHSMTQSAITQPDRLSLTAMINVYSKTGQLQRARDLFSSIANPDVTLWNAMIAGHSNSGDLDHGIQLLRSMWIAGVDPDGVTLLTVLATCAQKGLIDESCHHFQSLLTDHGVRAERSHFSCMVDLLARIGRLGDAIDLAMSMPFVPDEVELASLLSACGLHRDADQAARAAMDLGSVSPTRSSPYVLLSNAFVQEVTPFLAPGNYATL